MNRAVPRRDLASQLFFDCGRGMTDLPNRFGQPLFRYVKLVTPELDLVRFQETDTTTVLRTSVGKIVRHRFLR
jgi:hypothetical protein